MQAGAHHRDLLLWLLEAAVAAETVWHWRRIATATPVGWAHRKCKRATPRPVGYRDHTKTTSGAQKASANKQDARAAFRVWPIPATGNAQSGTIT